VLGALTVTVRRVADPGAFSVNPQRRNSAMASVAASYNVLAATSTACRMLFVSVNETRHTRGFGTETIVAQWRIKSERAKIGAPVARRGSSSGGGDPGAPMAQPRAPRLLRTTGCSMRHRPPCLWPPSHYIESSNSGRFWRLPLCTGKQMRYNPTQKRRRADEVL
jgi:hypothetical protein